MGLKALGEAADSCRVDDNLARLRHALQLYLQSLLFLALRFHFGCKRVTVTHALQHPIQQAVVVLLDALDPSFDLGAAAVLMDGFSMALFHVRFRVAEDLIGAGEFLRQAADNHLLHVLKVE
ncbi:hypothetical protein [Rhizobium sp. Leaf371]|uniref:hypothetical protein n=1 Tax=Rhizobium sp. Leaf371 TaxID=1736355 RepID=UPI001FCD6C93|nr:hypothetical protein [Rhizobium sp. Leaf371]